MFLIEEFISKRHQIYVRIFKTFSILVDYKPCRKKFITSIGITVESVPTVDSLMRIEPVEGAESILANFTPERFFSCMDSNVHFETVGR